MKTYTKAELRNARGEYGWRREYDARVGIQNALADTAVSLAMAGYDEPGLAYNLRHIMGAVVPERRWPLAAEIARAGVAWHAAYIDDQLAGGDTRMAASSWMHRVAKDAAAAQIAGMRWLYGGGRRG